MKRPTSKRPRRAPKASGEPDPPSPEPGSAAASEPAGAPAQAPAPRPRQKKKKKNPEKRRKGGSRRGRALSRLQLPNFAERGRRFGGKGVEAKSKGKKKGKKKTKTRKKKSTTGLWFRASTRVRALGYWLREKAQAGVKAGRALGARAADLWGSRSERGKIQIAAVAGVLVLWALLRFTALPGVPCGISTAKECAPGDDTVAIVPADSLLYAHVSLDGSTEQSERAADAFDRLSELERVVVGGASSALPAPSGAAVDLREDVLPWAEQDLAVALVPGKRAGALDEAFLAGVGDRGAAEQFLAMIAPSTPPTEAEQAGTTISLYPDGFASAFVEDQLAFGGARAVRAIADAAAGRRAALAGSPEGAPRDELPDARFAEVYVSRAGVKQLLAGRVGPAAQLETFVDYGATSGLAAALVASDDTLEVELISRLDPKLAKRSPGFFSELPAFEPGLADEAGERAIGYVEVGELGPTLTALLKGAGPRSQGLAGSLRASAARLQTEAGVNPLQDLLPALGGQAALIAEPTDGRPLASLIVDGVDEERASAALARLQGPLLRALGAGGGPGGRVPRFREQEVEGVLVRSVALSPAVNLSYAVFDGKLVISTSPAGVARVRSDSRSLADADQYRRATEGLPDEASALVFLNLDELFGQVVDIGLAEDPNFADLTVLFENASSVGLAVSGGDERIRTELSLALD